MPFFSFVFHFSRLRGKREGWRVEGEAGGEVRMEVGVNSNGDCFLIAMT